MPDPRWLDDREQRAWRAYQYMQRELSSTLERQLTRDSGLSGADYELLVVLSETAGNRVRARELRQQVGWDRSRLAHQVRRMEKRGLLRRTECETDARGTMIELTDDGRAVIEAAAPGHVEAVRGHFVDLLTPEEMVVLTTISGKVRTQIARSCQNAEPECSEAARGIRRETGIAECRERLSAEPDEKKKEIPLLSTLNI